MNKIKIYFKQLFCKHDFKEMADPEFEKWKDESIHQLIKGEISSFTETTVLKCTKCNKEEYYVTIHL